MTFANAKKKLTGSVLAALLAGSSVALTGGCMATGHGTLYARSEPPPPRYETVEARPGYVWVDGRWDWDDGAGEWVWYDGYYEPERTGYVYVRGSWEHRGDRYVYSRPRWQSRSNARAVIHVEDHSRPTRVRIRANSGGHVPARPVVVHGR